MDWVTTSTILERLHDFNNRSAWDRLVGRFRTPIISFALRMGLGHPDAEDLAQEALMAFADSYRAGKYDPARGRLSDWLFGIAYRQLLGTRKQLRRRERNVSSLGEDASILAQIPDEEAATKSWNEEWARAVLQASLTRVRREVEPTSIQAFELYALAKQPAADVAAQLGISRNAVFIAKHRVLKRLRELQEEYERVA